MPKRYPTLNGHPQSIIPYVGGKFRLINNIVPIIEYARRAYRLTDYYELCGGGGRMLLNLHPTIFNNRFYNELDLGICKLFACLGDKNYLYELQAMLEKWGCSEEIFKQAKQAREFESKMLEQGQDSYEMSMVEGAACAFVLAQMSRAADCVTFDHTCVRNKGRIQSYYKRVRELDLFYPTLAEVGVSQGDCLDLLKMYRKESEALMYLDPPYTPGEMSSSKHYGDRSWTLDDHERMVDVLLSTSAKVVLSGYNNKCYMRLEESGWRKIFLKNIHVSSSGLSARRNDEYVWVNFHIPTSLVEQISEVDYSMW